MHSVQVKIAETYTQRSASSSITLASGTTLSILYDFRWVQTLDAPLKRFTRLFQLFLSKNRVPVLTFFTLSTQKQRFSHFTSQSIQKLNFPARSHQIDPKTPIFRISARSIGGIGDFFIHAPNHANFCTTTRFFIIFK